MEAKELCDKLKHDKSSDSLRDKAAGGLPPAAKTQNSFSATVRMLYTRLNHVTGDFSHFHRESSNRSFKTLSTSKAVAFLIRFTHTTTFLPRILVKYSYVRPLATMVSSLPSLPSVLGTDPSSCILDAFRTAIAKRVSDALPPLTIEQAYTGVDYGKKGVDFTVALPRFRLPGKPDELAKKVITDVS